MNLYWLCNIFLLNNLLIILLLRRLKYLICMFKFDLKIEFGRGMKIIRKINIGIFMIYF